MNPTNPTNPTNHGLAYEIAKGSGITLVGSTIGKVVQLGTFILLGRVLGAKEYGLYALGFSAIMLTSQVSMLGLQNGLVRFIPLYNGEGKLAKVKGTLVAGFVISVIASLIVGAVLFVTADFLAIKVFGEPKLVQILRVFAFALPGFVLLQMAAHGSRGFHKMGYFVAIRNISWQLLNVLFIGAVLLAGFRLLGATYSFLLAVSITAALGWSLLAKNVFPQGRSVSAKYESRRLLRFAVPAMFIGLGTVILASADRFMISFFMDSADVGVYDAAARIAMQTAFVLVSINTAFAPMISNLYNSGHIDELGKLFQLATRWIVTLTLPLFLVLLLFPQLVMNTFGGEFEAGATVLVVLTIAQLVNAAAGSVGFMLIMSGKQDMELINVVILAAANIGLNLLLIPHWGILGAAIATGTSVAIVNIARLLEVQVLIGVHAFNRKWLKPILVAIVVAVAVSLARTLWSTAFAQMNTQMATLLLCPVIYIILLTTLGLEEEDRTIIKSLVGSLRSKV